MSNLFKQVKGEWVQMTDKEEDKMWSPGQPGVLRSLRMKLNHLIRS